MGHLLPVIRVSLTVLCLMGAANAQFQAPTQISSASSGCANPAIERDVTNNLAFAWDFDGDIFFASSVFTPGVDVNVTDGTLSASKPDVLNGFGGQIRLVFQRESSQPGIMSDDILTATNIGGPWGLPVNLTLSDDFDHDVKISNSFLGAFSFVWWHASVGGVDEVWLRRGLLNPNELIGPGSRPSVAYDFSEVAHVVYQRGGELYHVSYDGIALSAETPLGATPGAENVAMEALENVHLAYSAGGDIYYMNDEAGSLGQNELLDTGTSGAPRLGVGSAGHVVVVYAKGGEILMRERLGGTFGPADPVATTTAAESPDVEVDTFDFAHVVFQENGAIYYTNNVPPPTPEFTADVTSGEILLEVNFANDSSGVYDQLLWDFGDGTTSTDASPTHIYDEVGSYTVSLTLTGPGGTATETQPSYIVTSPPTNTLRVAEVAGFAGESIRHPVISTSTVPMQGYQLAIRYDNAVTPIADVNLEGTVTGSVGAEFVAFDFFPDGADSYAILGVVIELQKPITGVTIPPGTGQLLATLDYMIPIGLTAGTSSEVWLENGLGTPPINNIFSALVAGESFSLLPFLYGGSTLVGPPGTTFLRGDATSSGGIDIADAIFVLSFLFTSGPGPLCPDAADANDNGAIDVADAVYILSYLFADGAIPFYPFPLSGSDPTVDSLGPCL